MSDERLAELERQQADAPFELQRPSGGGNYTLTEREVAWVNAARVAVPELIAEVRRLRTEARASKAK